jgi:hypothetical protein
MQKLLLVEPNFPIPVKSRNHSHFLPIGLLKIGSYHKRLGDKVKLVRGLRRCGFKPDRILITSLFTYWSSQVHEAAAFYHRAYPTAQIEIGGIYASLMQRHCKRQSSFAKVSRGLYRGGAAEKVQVDFSLLPEPLDYQVVHTSRGCVRRCTFCGTWRIEPEFTYKPTIIPEIQKQQLVFYDNNLLANPNIDKILVELANYRTRHGNPLRCDSQSGFDLRLLTDERARLLKQAHFVNPRVAWDGPYSQWPAVRRAVNLLKKVGYGYKDIYVFMIYNHALSFLEMMKKLDACRRWNVRVIDCRYRPLDCTEEDYQPSMQQGIGSYYIHPNWTDKTVHKFRSRVRRQNIAVLLQLPNRQYIAGCESRKVTC